MLEPDIRGKIDPILSIRVGRYHIDSDALLR
jgi:hypothetical protein